MHVQNHLKGENFEVQHQHDYENTKAKKSFNNRNKERNLKKKFDALEVCVTLAIFGEYVENTEFGKISDSS